MSTCAATDSVFDDYRARINELERRVRDATLTLHNRNDRLLGHDVPSSQPHGGISSSTAVQPIGPLVNEVQMALSSLDDAIGSLVGQVHRQAPLG